MKRFFPAFVTIAIIAILITFHWKNLNSFPTKIHSWAQSDRYALAIGFNNNGFDFFHPQTYNYTESPDHKLIPKETSITAVDFPINEYFVALLMKLFGTTDPWCFRIYTFIYSVIGLIFLFLISRKILQNNTLSIFIVLFCVTSPIYLYYQIGFLPTIPAISNLFIGLYLYIRYLETERNRDYFLAILFITIAVLSRKPFLIFLLSLIAFELWKSIKNKKVNTGVVLATVLSATSIIGYYLFNQHLEKKYGTAFLGFLLPPDSFSQSVEITRTVFKNWFFQYFTVFHYILFLVLALIAVYYSFKRKLDKIKKSILFIGSLSLLGYLAYYLVMMKQFPDHDYYFLDSFYAVVCLFLVLAVGLLPLNAKRSSIIGFILIPAFIVILFTTNKKVQQKREETGFWDRVEITTNNFDGAEALLSENRIPTTAKILVIDSYTANIPFIKMKRFGYAMMSKQPDDIKRSLTWNFDYVVMQDCFAVSDIIRNYPQIVNELERIGGNGKISIYKRQKTTGKRDSFQFIQLDSIKPIIEKRIDFDSNPDSCWQGIFSRIITGSPYAKSGVQTDSLMYSTTLSIKNCIELTQNPCILSFTGDINTEEVLSGTRVAVSVDENGKSKYFNTFELSDQVDSLSIWKHVQLVFPVLPQLRSGDNELKVFIWNDGRHHLYYDNLCVRVYKQK